MEIQELQKKSEDIVNLIDKKLKVNHNDELVLMHLTEELDEIAREILNPKFNRDKKNTENIKDEIADIFLLTSKLADNNNIDIEEAVNNKIIKLKQRHNLQ